MINSYENNMISILSLYGIIIPNLLCSIVMYLIFVFDIRTHILKYIFFFYTFIIL